MSFSFILGPSPSYLICRKGLYAVTLLFGLHNQFARPLSGAKAGFSYPFVSLKQLEKRSDQMEDFLISALVRAGQCKDHAIPCDKVAFQPCTRLSASSHHFRRNSQASRVAVRSYHATTPCYQQGLHRHRKASYEEYLGLVDHYANIPVHNTENSAPLPPAMLPPPTEQQDRGEIPSTHSSALPEDEDSKIAFKALRDALEEPDCPQETVYELYRALPAPRITYLSRSRIRLLMRRLSVVERKSVPTRMRYLSVVDDLKAAGIPLSVAEWNSAISFAGRCLARVSAAQVESALSVFREMELESGVRANHVTFNILVDLATKAGKYVLAELMLKEMRARSLDLNRFGGVGLIYHFGLKGDGDGVRTAYRRFLDDGHIVDTVVLNCVIAALIKAGEAPAAEHVYEKMKLFSANREGVPLPPRFWRDIRALGKALQRDASLAKGNRARHRKLQANAILAPDLRTYRILIIHHSIETGRLERIITLLQEMRWYEVQLHASIFLALLKGFSLHGGVRNTQWTRSLLEGVWSAYLHAADTGVDGIYLGKWLVIWGLHAYGKCAGKKRMLEVWEEVKTRWEPTEDELVMVKKVIGSIIMKEPTI